jgi:hypothetical protein
MLTIYIHLSTHKIAMTPAVIYVILIMVITIECKAEKRYAGNSRMGY